MSILGRCRPRVKVYTKPRIIIQNKSLESGLIVSYLQIILILLKVDLVLHKILHSF